MDDRQHVERVEPEHTARHTGLSPEPTAAVVGLIDSVVIGVDARNQEVLGQVRLTVPVHGRIDLGPVARRRSDVDLLVRLTADEPGDGILRVRGISVEQVRLGALIVWTQVVRLRGLGRLGGHSEVLTGSTVTPGIRFEANLEAAERIAVELLVHDVHLDRPVVEDVRIGGPPVEVLVGGDQAVRTLEGSGVLTGKARAFERGSAANLGELVKRVHDLRVGEQTAAGRTGERNSLSREPGRRLTGRSIVHVRDRRLGQTNASQIHVRALVEHVGLVIRLLEDGHHPVHVPHTVLHVTKEVSEVRIEGEVNGLEVLPARLGLGDALANERHVNQRTGGEEARSRSLPEDRRTLGHNRAQRVTHVLLPLDVVEKIAEHGPIFAEVRRFLDQVIGQGIVLIDICLSPTLTDFLVDRWKSHFRKE